ncbi:hypothetical protein N136_02320 [Leifsonia aquatica ATCC 14665]|uniref:Squalene cyclase C-terminal domain-containing protein n=2 Tax=Leifsonia aquatica TaxID=144185 RepID=U2RR66_LEIAQ|nr:hypothetical protein N136_02320 [Leifsonia aquatica ATCC 14665]
MSAMTAIDWLLDADPALRWQALRDLTDATDEEVATERSRVAREGWGAELLAAQDADGRWDGGTYRPGWVDESRPFFDAWTATHFVLQQLADFGVDPAAPEVREAIARVRENVRWEHAGERYFDGEVEPCINGMALAAAAYFGEDGSRIAATLVDGRLVDGAWNCWAEYGARVSSFHSTICVVEGLAAWRGTGRADPAVAEALASGEEYLLERGLYRRRSTGAVADPRMTMLSYPVRWYHDVLRGLEHFRTVDRRDPRLADAVELLRGKADERGLWRLENHHEGPAWNDWGEGEGHPSRWITLRALRVLRWWDDA